MRNLIYFIVASIKGKPSSRVVSRGSSNSFTNIISVVILKDSWVLLGEGFKVKLLSADQWKLKKFRGMLEV